MELSNEEKTKIMEQLKATLLKDIELQARLRRMGWIILSLLFLIVLVLAGFVIYFQTKKPPASEVTLEYITNEKRGIELERKAIAKERDQFNVERQNISKARMEVILMISKMDSLLNKKQLK